MTQYRTLKRDGTLNLGVKQKSFNVSDLYHTTLSIESYKLFIFVFLAYLFINLFFASLYFMGGNGALSGTAHDAGFAYFLDCFFFSVQTFATIGYGKITPMTVFSNIIVTIEAICGLFSVAIITGIVFARFAKPNSKIIFSNIAIIANHNGKKQLHFRIANLRMNQIVDAKILVTLAIDEETIEKEKMRKLYDLELERNHTPIFGVSWTIRHTINEKSPLAQLTCEDLRKQHAEILVIFTGLDNTFSQTVNARFSYISSEIIENAKFVDIINRNEHGQLIIHHDKIHDYLPT